jgi:hypothetical protein
MAKLICEKELNGELILCNLTTVAGVVPTLVITTPGVGKPFWFWNSIPVGKIVACDFTNAPIASADVAENLAAMNAITAQPQDVLTYDPPLTPTA